MKKLLVYSIFSFLLLFDLYAQVPTTDSNDLLFVCIEPSSKDYSPREFMSPDWQEADLVDYKNKVHQVKVRYHVAYDEMQLLLGNKTRTILPQKIKKIRIGNMVFAPSEFEKDGYLTYGYFNILSSGKVDLLSRFVTGDGKISKEYFYSKTDLPAVPLKSNKKSVLQVLHSSGSCDYYKKEKLNLKDEKDLIRLFEYHNKG